MNKPAEYIETIEDFLESGTKAVKFEKASREDYAALVMVAYLKELSVRVILQKGVVYLMREQ